MRVLYVASDQTLPGRTGGSVHVLEVSRGLAARGHEVQAVVHAEGGLPPREERDGFVLHRVRWSPPGRVFRFRAHGAVTALARAFSPAVVMERYYNFGGEGLRAAGDCGVPAVLEVNSPMVDHPGSWKARLDAAALVRPLRRWREWQCGRAAALVSPLRDIVPEPARARTEVVTWGANVDVFHPRLRREERRREWGVPEGATVVLFSGSFRPWHGVHLLEEAARRLRDRTELFFLLVGGGETGVPAGYRGRRLGPVPYEGMGEVVASADVGVAPYDRARLGQLRLGFYWSPLKIFEYMASALPVVTIPVPPLTEIVRAGQEAVFVPEGDPAALAQALLALAGDPAGRARLGASARARVVERYSWAGHCAQLERVLERVRS